MTVQTNVKYLGMNLAKRCKASTGNPHTFVKRDKEICNVYEQKEWIFVDFNSSRLIYRLSTITLKIPTHIFVKCDMILKKLIGQVKEGQLGLF